MNYVGFLFKKIYSNKFYLFPFLLVFLAIMVCLFFNSSNKSRFDIVPWRQMNLESAEEFVKNVEDRGEDNELLIQAREAVAINQEILEYISKENWKQAYSLIIQTIPQESDSPDYPPEYINAIEQDRLMYQALEKRNIPFQVTNFPTESTLFLVWVVEYIFPVLLMVGLIFSLTQLFSGLYYQKINTVSLLPRSEGNILFYSFIGGFLFSLLAFAGLLFLSFTMSSILFGNGRLNYPIWSFDINSKEQYFQDLSKLLLPSFLLQILSFSFIVLFVYFATYLLKEKLLSLFFSLFLLIGSLLVVDFIGPLRNIAHLLPTTYFKSVTVVTGRMADNLKNYKISFQNGWIVLTTSCLLLVLSVLLTQKKFAKLASK